MCSIGTSAPAGSPMKSQKINFVLERGDMSLSSTHEFPVATGASKSLGELQALLGGALRRGLTAGAGTELVKVGDIMNIGQALAFESCFRAPRRAPGFGRTPACQ